MSDSAPVDPVGFRAGHDAAVLALSFSPDGRTLATAGDDNKVALWAVP
jgi:WD40 repeat protein